MKYFQVSMSESMKDYLDKLVKSGQYNSRSEIIREALRLHMKLEVKMRLAI